MTRPGELGEAYLRGFRAAFVRGVRVSSILAAELRLAYEAGLAAGKRALRQAESGANEYERRCQAGERQSPGGRA